MYSDPFRTYLHDFDNCFVKQNACDIGPCIVMAVPVVCEKMTRGSVLMRIKSSLSDACLMRVRLMYNRAGFRFTEVAQGCDLSELLVSKLT